MASDSPEVRAATEPLTLRTAHEADAAAWDAFVESHPEGRFCQLWGFRRALERAYGYRCAYFDICVDGRRVGVFPSIVVRHGSGRLVSQPMNEYGGPLTLGLDANQHVELAQALLATARREGCSTVEIRGGLGSEPMLACPLCVRHPLHGYADLVLEAPDVLWRRVRHEARKAVNSARRAGLVVRVRSGPAAVADPFYDLYLASMKRLGVPPHPRRFFDELAAGLGERMVAAWAAKGDVVAAALLGCTSGRRIQIFVDASDPAHWALRPNDLAHWGLITWAYERGLERFDFGSARYAGQIHYKKKWGVAFHDYGYTLLGAPGSHARRIQTVRTSSPLMETLATTWRAVVPVGLTAWLGPPIRKFLTK